MKPGKADILIFVSARDRINSKSGGWVLVWVNERGTSEHVDSWDVYPTITEAQAEIDRRKKAIESEAQQ